MCCDLIPLQRPFTSRSFEAMTNAYERCTIICISSFALSIPRSHTFMTLTATCFASCAFCMFVFEVVVARYTFALPPSAMCRVTCSRGNLGVEKWSGDVGGSDMVFDRVPSTSASEGDQGVGLLDSL